MVSLKEINGYTRAAAESFFYELFLSREMAEDLAAMRPFQSTSDLLNVSNELWLSLPKKDQIEAINAHPRVGDIQAALDTKYSCNEQSALCSSSDELLSELDSLNKEYENRYGHIYLACANDRKPDEIIKYMKSRMDLDSEEEFNIAIEEKIAIHLARIAQIKNNSSSSRDVKHDNVQM